MSLSSPGPTKTRIAHYGKELTGCAAPLVTG
jgi:hypothetical protein